MQASQTPMTSGETGSGAVHRLPVSLELPAADALHAELLSRLQAGTDLVIDGQDVEAVSSACLQVLASASASADARGQGFHLQTMSGVLAEAIRNLGLAGALGLATA